MAPNTASTKPVNRLLFFVDSPRARIPARIIVTGKPGPFHPACDCAASQGSEHDVGIHITKCWVQKCTRQRPDNLEPVPFPETHGAFIRTNDEIELHRAKAGSGSTDERIAAHCTCHAAPVCKRRGHVSAVGYMRPATLLIRAENVCAENDAVVLGNEN